MREVIISGIQLSSTFLGGYKVQLLKDYLEDFAPPPLKLKFNKRTYATELSPRFRPILLTYLWIPHGITTLGKK